MMINKKLLSLTFTLAVLISCCASVIPFHDYVSTEKYAIVGIKNCTVTTEIMVPEGLCSYHMTDHEMHARSELKCQPFFSVLYVPVEDDSPHPSKLLVIHEERNRGLAYHLEDIGFPVNHSHAVTTINFSTFAFFADPPKFADIIGVVYDHLGSFLYIIHKDYEYGQETAKARVYLMLPNQMKPNGLDHTFLYSFKVAKYFLDTEWSSDAYTQKFYYHKIAFSKAQGYTISKVFSMPYSSLAFSLQTDLPGRLEKEYATDDPRRHNVQVSHGLVYTTGPKGRYLSTLTQVNGTACESFGKRSQDYLFVVTGWEYCKLEEHESSDYEVCLNKEIEESVPDATEPPKSSSSGFLWAITLAIIINAVILLIILCVLCKRKEVEKLDNGMYPVNKEQNGALLTPEEIYSRRRNTSTLTEF